MSQSYYIRPDEMFTLDGNVSTGAGFDTPAYQPEYGTDGRPDTPVRFTSGDGSVTITNTARTISALILAFHNVIADVGISGGVTTTIPAVSQRPNGIPYNAWKQVTEVSVSTLTYAITSNPAGTVIVGEYIAGKLRTFPGAGNEGGLLIEQMKRSPRNLKMQTSGRMRPYYDTGDAARDFGGGCFATYAEVEDIIALYESQNNGNRYIVLIPKSEINDAPVVAMDEPQIDQVGYDLFKIGMMWREYPRGRW